MITVGATEFKRNFNTYQRQARQEPVAVTRNGHTAGYFVSPEEFDELSRYRLYATRSVRTVDLPAETIEALMNTRMDPRHDSLNALLDDPI